MKNIVCFVTGLTLSRKILLACVLLALVVVLAVALWFVYADRGGFAPPNSNSGVLVMSQLSNNDCIGDIASDPGLRLADYTSVLGAAPDPISNNIYMKKDGKTLLYDELIVGRVIRANSDLVNFANGEDGAVFESALTDSAEAQFVSKLDDSKIAFHSMEIGDIGRSGNEYYLITRESYTLARNGELAKHEGVFVYTLKPHDGEVLIADVVEV